MSSGDIDVFSEKSILMDWVNNVCIENIYVIILTSVSIDIIEEFAKRRKAREYCHSSKYGSNFPRL